MKLTTKTLIGLLIITVSFIVTYRAINLSPSANIDEEKKFMAIVENSGCLLCHNKNAKLPSYSIIPLVGSKIRRDSERASKLLDIAEILKYRDNGITISGHYLNLIDSVIIDNSMPPFSFTIFRPGSAINSGEEEVILEWTRKERIKGGD